MNVFLKELELKKINFFLCSSFKYNSKEKNFNNLKEILDKKNNILSVKNHIFIDLLNTKNNISCILHILRKYSNNKQLKKIANLKQIFFHNYTINVSEKIIKLLKDKEQLNFLVCSIMKNGFIHNAKSPVVVMSIKNKLVLVDGFHRFFACYFLKTKYITTEVYEM